MAVMRDALLFVFQCLLGAVIGLGILAAIRFVLGWPPRPPRQAGTEVPLPPDPNAEDWEAWEAELKSEEAEGADEA